MCFIVLPYDFQDSVGYLLCVTSSAMQEAINAELARHGITFRQMQVLCWLAHEGESISQGELATRMCIEPPTLVGILDRMEQHGWITRESCSDDRRKKIVRPAAAEEVWETMIEAMLRVRRRATSRLTTEQTEMLKDMLRTVHATLTDGQDAMSCETGCGGAASGEDAVLADRSSS